MARVTRVEAAGATDVGRLRAHDEDAFGSFPELGLYVVVDGFGGVAAGEVAARVAIDAIRGFFEATARTPDRPWPFPMRRQRSYAENRLVAAVQLAGRKVFEAAEASLVLRGMGAAACALVVQEDVVRVAHVGDVRAYRLRGRQLRRLTEDHTLANELVRAEKLRPEEALAPPYTTIITRALGLGAKPVEVDVLSDTPEDGDVYLLCTDGLWKPVPEATIAQHLSAPAELARVASALVDAANEAGGPDNIGCLIVRVGAR